MKELTEATKHCPFLVLDKNIPLKRKYRSECTNSEIENIIDLDKKQIIHMFYSALASELVKIPKIKKENFTNNITIPDTKKKHIITNYVLNSYTINGQVITYMSKMGDIHNSTLWVLSTLALKDNNIINLDEIRFNYKYYNYSTGFTNIYELAVGFEVVNADIIYYFNEDGSLIKDSEEFKQKSRENSKKQYQKKIAEKPKKEYKLSEEERAKHRMYYQKRKIQSQNITTN